MGQISNIYTHYNLSRNGFRYIEKLLYEHKKADILIAEYEAELNNVVNMLDRMEPNIVHVPDGMPRGTGVSFPTENLAITKADSIQVKYLKDRINEIKRHKQAIDTALQYLTDTERLFVKLKYELEYSPKQCMEKMGYGKTRGYEIRHEVVKKIASYLEVY